MKVRDEVLEHVHRRRCSPRATSSSRTTRASARRRSRARCRARSTAQFARVQCTADLLPADIVGTNVYNQREARFEFRPGPIFANVVLVDEINRASPKTQSGLLECMQERHVTVDAHLARAGAPVHGLRDAEPGRVRGHLPAARGAGRPLHGPPVARLSRTPSDEAGMLAGHEAGDRVLDLEPVADRAEVLDAIDAAHRVHASQALRDYVVALLRRTRADPRVELGASPRAGLMLLRAAKARALSRAATTRCPTTSRRSRQPVLAHRLMLVPEAAGIQRRDDRRRRRVGDAGARRALAMRSAAGCAAPRAGAAARRRDVRRRAAVRHRLGAAAARRRRRRRGSALGARGRERASARSTRAAWSRRSRCTVRDRRPRRAPAAAAGLRSTSRCCPSPCASRRPARARACASR